MSWSVQQLTVLERFAGALSVAELAAELAHHGDPHNERSIVQQAHVSSVSLGRRKRWHAWSEEEDAIICREAGRHTAAEIAMLLRRECQYPRTAKSVRRHCEALGVSLTFAATVLSLDDVSVTLSAHKATIKGWVVHGLLRADRCGRGVAGDGWRFLPADLEAFLDAYPVLYDWRVIQGERWQQIARRAATRSPWVGVEQAATVLQLAPKTVRTQVKTGRIAGAFKVGRRWRIPASALPLGGRRAS